MRLNFAGNETVGIHLVPVLESDVVLTGPSWGEHATLPERNNSGEAQHLDA